MVPSSLVDTGTGTHPDAFHCHRVPDSFRLPLVMDSWKFVLEIHWTWSELYGFDCSIPGVFSGRIGIGRFSWALQDPARNHPLLVTRMEPHGIPVVHTGLFFMKGPVRLSWD